MSTSASILCETVENKKRGRGRPRAYDPDEAIDKAIALFWTKGFDATSLDDLSEAMGMGRPSLYHAFGDKDAIFMRCLKRYTDTVCTVPLLAFDAAETVESAVYAYLRATADYSSCTEDHLGCLFGAALTVDDGNVRDFVAASVAGGRAHIAKRLQAAVDSGELPASFPVERRAQRAINAMLALTVRARHGVALTELLEDVDDAVAAVVSFQDR